MPPEFGLDRLAVDSPPFLREGPVGVVTNAAATTADLRTAVEVLLGSGVEVAIIFAPEHGFTTGVPAGERVDHQVDPLTGVPIYSLYGERFAPPVEMLDGLTRIIVDLPDVGARFYTYVSTLVHVLRAAAQAGVPVLVLDRANPIDGVSVEGPILQEGYTSFVGMLPVPVRHGMTVGELARFANDVLDIGASLDVIPVRKWRRREMADAWGRPWVPPSPNMPHVETALLYPGMCLVEGTNLSEGRGTPYPFSVVGAPWVDGHVLAHHLNALGLFGVRFRPVSFLPCAGKYAGERCQGVQVHVTDRAQFRPVRTGIAILTTVRALYPESFTFPASGTKEDLRPFDRLIGNGKVRAQIEAGVPYEEIVAPWHEEEMAFRQQRRDYLFEEA